MRAPELISSHKSQQMACFIGLICVGKSSVTVNHSFDIEIVKCD